MSIGKKAKPLSIEQVATSRIPGSQAGAKLRDPRCPVTKAGQSKPPAYVRMPEPCRHAMPARDLDRRLGSFLRLSELAPEVVQDRGPGQSEGEAVDVFETLGNG